MATFGLDLSRIERGALNCCSASVRLARLGSSISWRSLRTLPVSDLRTSYRRWIWSRLSLSANVDQSSSKPLTLRKTGVSSIGPSPDPGSPRHRARSATVLRHVVEVAAVLEDGLGVLIPDHEIVAKT